MSAAQATADDDADTLGRLSCGAGQVAIDVGGWRCADPVVTRGVVGSTNRTLETSDNVGQYTSVGIGSDGNPVISHFDDTNDDLELAIATVAVVGVGFE